MDVFVIPVGHARYELYCETPDDDPIEDRVETGGLVERMVARFRAILARVERERHEARLRQAEADRAASPPRERRRWGRRVRDRLLRWLAERIAEQRLLWQLRRQTAVTAVYPDDLEESAAMALVRVMLQRDADRHLRWLIVHSLLFAITGPLFFFVPGPNLIAYYFAFRALGHYLSMRGARHGLRGVTWSLQPNAALGELRRAIKLPPRDREQRVRDVAERLKLDNLPTFFERTAVV